MKRNQLLLIVLIVAIVVVAVFVLFNRQGQDRLVGVGTELIAFTARGTSIGKGIFYIPFIRTLKQPASISVSIGGVQVIDAIPVYPKKDWRSGFPVSLAAIPEGVSTAQISVDGKLALETKFNRKTEEADILLDLASVTRPEESMKGWGAKAALAGEPATQATRGSVPDLTQRTAECAPTAAANNVMSLAEEHGTSPADLPTPTEIVDGLKADMDWTPADGVLPDNFVSGKNKWAARNGLPIRTEKVGDAQGARTIQDILDAMAGGGAAELRIRFSTPDGRVVGGHMVTVTGVRTEAGQTFIDINDPKTPAGTETYEVNGNIIEGYPSEFLATASWGFVQRWEGTPTGVPLDTMTEEEIRGIQEFVGQKEKIKVIVVNGKKVPIAQVHVGTGPECGPNEAPHYHANTGSVTALDGTVIPDPGACGYGKVRDVPVEEVVVN